LLITHRGLSNQQAATRVAGTRQRQQQAAAVTPRMGCGSNRRQQHLQHVAPTASTMARGSYDFGSGGHQQQPALFC